MTGEKKQSVDAGQCESKPAKRLQLLAGAVVVLLASGIVLAAFYVGSTMQQHNNVQKTTWATLINADDPRQSVTEKVVVTDTEADIIRPGVIRFILDTKNGYLTFLQDTPITDGKLNQCYVADVDVKGQARDIKSHLHVKQVVHFSANTHDFELTDEPVDPILLSFRTHEMCFGRDVMKAYEITEASRVRRSGRVRLLFGLIDVKWGKDKDKKATKKKAGSSHVQTPMLDAGRIDMKLAEGGVIDSKLL